MREPRAQNVVRKSIEGRNSGATWPRRHRFATDASLTLPIIAEADLLQESFKMRAPGSGVAGEA
jgi:hypothetical protein